MTQLNAGRLLWPDGRLAPGQVTIEDGLVVSVVPCGRPPADTVLAPGFIDLQVNGSGPVDVLRADGDDWSELDRLLVAQGVTSWCPTVVTCPAELRATALERIAVARGRADGTRPEILGAHLEGPLLGSAALGAHSAELVAAARAEDLSSPHEVVRIVTLAPEAPDAIDLVRHLSNRGVLVAMGHSACGFAQAEAAVDAGARLVTHLYNAMSPLHHREPAMVGAALSDDRVFTSLIADLVHVHPAALRIAARAKPPGKLVLVTDAVAVRSAAEDPVPERASPPRTPDGRLAGSVLTMDAAVRNMVGCGAIDLAGALHAASTAPASVLGLTDRGSIQVGARADLVELGTDLHIRRVWIGGAPVFVA